MLAVEWVCWGAVWAWLCEFVRLCEDELIVDEGILSCPEGRWVENETCLRGWVVWRLALWREGGLVIEFEIWAEFWVEMSESGKELR